MRRPSIEHDDEKLTDHEELDRHRLDSDDNEKSRELPIINEQKKRR
jgi:hypothetical protein